MSSAQFEESHDKREVFEITCYINSFVLIKNEKTE